MQLINERTLLHICAYCLPSCGCCMCTTTRADHMLSVQPCQRILAALSFSDNPTSSPPSATTITGEFRLPILTHPSHYAGTRAHPASNFIVVVVQCCVVVVICLFDCSVCVVRLTYSPLSVCSVAHTPVHTILMHSRYKAQLRLYAITSMHTFV